MDEAHYIDFLRQTLKILIRIKNSPQRINLKLKSAEPHILNLKGSAAMFGFEKISAATKKFLSAKEIDKIEFFDQLIGILKEDLSILDKISFYKHVLIIDDDEHIRTLIKTKLNSKNIEVQETLSIAQSKVIDFSEIQLILLDLNLPDGDGRSLLCQLQKRPDTCTIPVWIFSAIENSSLINECILLGAEKYIVKPVNPNKLSEMILDRLEKKIINKHDDLIKMFSMIKDLNMHSLIQIILFDHNNSLPAENICISLYDYLSDFVDSSQIMEWKSARLLLLIKKNKLSDFKARLEDFYKKHECSRDLSIYMTSANYLENDMDIILGDLFTPGHYVKNFLPGVKWLDSRMTDKNKEASILLADDDPMILKLVSHRLSKEGYKTVQCENGEELLKMLKKFIPELIIMDVKMPVCDGFQTLKKLRETSKYDHIPVILLTSLGSETNILKGFQLGVSDYVTKPFSNVELVARVNRLLEGI